MESYRYIDILAKVMHNHIFSKSNLDKERFNQLLHKIYIELKPELRTSMCSVTTRVVENIEKMITELEMFYLCPEIVGKKNVLISSRITSSVFELCRSQFLDQKTALRLKKIRTQIPFLIVDTNENLTIEALNYANARVELNLDEFRYLITESGKKKIALNKIIQCFIVKTKLNDPNLCIIMDNIYSDARHMFRRAVSLTLAYIDEKALEFPDKRNLSEFSVILLSDEAVNQDQKNLIENNYMIVASSQINNYIEQEAKAVIYGFWEGFILEEMRIVDYYEKSLLKSRSTLNQIKSDIVRLGGERDGVLRSIRSFEQKRIDRLESEFSSITQVLYSIRELVESVSFELGDGLKNDKTVLGKTIDDVFDAFFRCTRYDDGVGQKILSKIHSYNYDGIDLVDCYIKSLSTKVKYEAIDIQDYEWEKAKMLIAVLDVQQIPNEKLKRYVEVLGVRSSTGKELFAKSLVSTAHRRVALLQESLEKGYELAGDELIELYREGNERINLLSLANALVPEACMIIANQKRDRKFSKTKFVNLEAPEFVYYKLAASKEHLPAIGRIVDVVFESRFSNGFQIPLKLKTDEKYIKMIEYGQLVLQFCRFLIDKMYNLEKYKMIYGIILFSLNENLSEAMNLLKNVDTPLACYCKGCMYEFGNGSEQDLDQAIKYYRKAKGIIPSERLEKRLNECTKKLERSVYERSRSDRYNSSNDYSASVTRTGSTTSEGCFTPNTKILMEDGSYREVKDIKIGDQVVVFDHYNGFIGVDRIVANVHDGLGEMNAEVIKMIFENGTILELVQSHILFDITQNEYVWVDKNSIKDYVGHLFAYNVDGNIASIQLVDYSCDVRKTKYYAPISRFHMNVFAENFLTMPPTRITLNFFPMGADMKYDLSALAKAGETSYAEIAGLVTEEEFENLPCKYLSVVFSENQCTVTDFEEALRLYREQKNI